MAFAPRIGHIMAAFGYNVQTIAGRLLKVTFVCSVILFQSVVPTIARRSPSEPVELTLYPAKAPELAERHRLLPKTYGQTDADAVPLYEEAARTLPENLDMNQIRQWLDTPLDKLPGKQVRSTLDKLRPTLQ